MRDWILTAFFGTALACLSAIALALSRWDDPRALYWVIGSVLYLVGSLFVTMLFNVPRNNALAALAPSTPEAVELWHTYRSSWSAWNHVRTAAALGAAAAFTIAVGF